MGKSRIGQDRFLVVRGDVFHYKRRVPSDVAHLDARFPHVRTSLHTRSVLEARMLRDRLVHEDDALWNEIRWGHRSAGQTEEVEDRPSVVYFLRAGGRIKVGRTSDLKGRMATLQTGSAYRISLMLSFSGGAVEEQILHRALKPWRLHGEWFRAAVPVMKLAKALRLAAAGSIVPAQLATMCADIVPQ